MPPEDRRVQDLLEAIRRCAPTFPESWCTDVFMETTFREMLVLIHRDTDFALNVKIAQIQPNQHPFSQGVW
jgi:hypothetical protein